MLDRASRPTIIESAVELADSAESGDSMADSSADFVKISLSVQAFSKNKIANEYFLECHALFLVKTEMEYLMYTEL